MTLGLPLLLRMKERGERGREEEPSLPLLLRGRWPPSELTPAGDGERDPSSSARRDISCLLSARYGQRGGRHERPSLLFLSAAQHKSEGTKACIRANRGMITRTARSSYAEYARPAQRPRSSVDGAASSIPSSVRLRTMIDWTRHQRRTRRQRRGASDSDRPGSRGERRMRQTESRTGAPPARPAAYRGCYLRRQSCCGSRC